MADADPDILAIDRGTITAPAGCGKTHLIADALTRHTASKPILVLTHTNAGVVALRSRLDKFGVPLRAYRLSTIDGWAMRLAATYPMRCRFVFDGNNPDYRRLREVAANLIAGRAIDDVLDNIHGSAKRIHRARPARLAEFFALGSIGQA